MHMQMFIHMQTSIHNIPQYLVIMGLGGWLSDKGLALQARGF